MTDHEIQNFADNIVIPGEIIKNINIVTIIYKYKYL